MNKTILAILVGTFLISGALYLTRPVNEKNEKEEVVVEEEKEEEEEENSENLPEKEENEEEINMETSSLMDCLKEEGVVVYGSKTCPACAQLVSAFGGYDVIAPIYVECMEDGDRCSSEKQTGYVPEIQIKGELYKESRSPEVIASEVGCNI
jgi:hypothetical protein